MACFHCVDVNCAHLDFVNIKSIVTTAYEKYLNINLILPGINITEYKEYAAEYLQSIGMLPTAMPLYFNINKTCHM